MKTARARVEVRGDEAGRAVLDGEHEVNAGGAAGGGGRRGRGRWGDGEGGGTRLEEGALEVSTAGDGEHGGSGGWWWSGAGEMRQGRDWGF